MDRIFRLAEKVTWTQMLGVAGTLGGILLGFLVGLWLESPPARPAVRIVSGKSGTTLALSGRPVLLKAVLPPRPGHALRSSWSFGDGSPAVESAVTDPYAVAASHLYAASPPGTAFVAILTITDVASGAKAVGRSDVVFVEPTAENKTAIALDDGLWALHASMIREEDPVHGSIGYWSRESYPVAVTSLSALAFEVNGFDSRASRGDSPYRETVDRALGFLLSRLGKIKLGGEKLGITVPLGDHAMYEVPLVSMALTASQAPGAIATSGPEGVIGRSRREIVSDMLDFLAYYQNKQPPYRGGWRYSPYSGDADMSVTQWPILAFMSAREVFGIETPASVSSELGANFLQHVQAPDGSFGYQGPSDRYACTRLTAAGLIGLRFVGASSTDDRVVRAESYIAKNWGSNNRDCYYAMYAVMKAAKLAETPVEKFGTHDWKAEYTEQLCQTQNPDGTWPRAGAYSWGTLSTAWPTLIISKDVFATARPTTLGDFWPVLLPFPPIMLAGVVFAFRRRRH